MNAYTQLVAAGILVNAILVLSLFVVFQCGVLSLATVGFMADGAYTASLLVIKQHWPAALALLAGALLAAAFAYVFGRLVLHLRGIYLALGTFALGQVFVLGIANLSFTGAAAGLVGMPVDVTLTDMVVVVVVIGIVLQLVHVSYVGRALRAIRLDERVAAGTGINVVRYRTLAFTASGALAGLAGGLGAFQTGVISPDQYSFTLLVQLLALAMIAGSYLWAGGLVTAIVIGIAQQYIGTTDPLVEGLLYGGLLIVVMMLVPNGITDPRLLRRLTPARWRSGGRPPRASPQDRQPASPPMAAPS
jgi:branched-chain amino acid transport system permease protein